MNRLFHFYYRFKNLYRTHHSYPSLRTILKWAWVQSRKSNGDPDRLDKFKKAGITVTNWEDMDKKIWEDIDEKIKEMRDKPDFRKK